MAGFTDRLSSLFDNTALVKASDIDQSTLITRYGLPESQWLALSNELNLHYLDYGDPEHPTLLLVHGLLMDSHVWHKWVQTLSRTHRVIALDLPGHGLSRAPSNWTASIDNFVEVLHQAVTKLALRDITLIGHSMGGYIGWRYAMTHGASLHRLGLIAAAGWPDQRRQAKNAHHFMSFAGSTLGRTVLRYANGDRFVSEGMATTFAPACAPEAIIDRYQDMLHGPGHREVLLSLAHEWADNPAAEAHQLGRLTCPVLIMGGDCDRVIPAEHAYRFDQAFAQNRFHLYPRCGHVPMLSCPEKALEDILSWLAATTSYT
ncbi:alpha/beta fold hydrolase [Larsenimonas salina]|uniref:alpha/beta fold hydrolase n=1 Tax=Larsenimonas salina TaxID=1295565 RepID=UPI0020738A0D|nr:alpha/beta hydrolase [Larsenimonas salina]MCM5705401.1 alpha/beta hydrolase [Larsenimonas salina]